MPINSGVLSGYTEVSKEYFVETYKLFGSGKKEPLFKMVDSKKGKITYYALTSFLSND